MAWLFSILRDELPKNLFHIALSALGFLVALGITGVIERFHERETFRSLLVALRAEATSNQTIISLGYDKFFPKGVVLREFRTATAQSILSTPLAIKYLKDREINSINKYVSDLSLANGYRRVIESLTFSPPKDAEGWLQNVRESLSQTLTSVKSDLVEINNIKR